MSHSRCGTLKIPTKCSMTKSAEQRSNLQPGFTGNGDVSKWQKKNLDWDEKSQTNKKESIHYQWNSVFLKPLKYVSLSEKNNHVSDQYVSINWLLRNVIKWMFQGKNIEFTKINCVAWDLLKLRLLIFTFFITTRGYQKVFI